MRVILEGYEWFGMLDPKTELVSMPGKKLEDLTILESLAMF